MHTAKRHSFKSLVGSLIARYDAAIPNRASLSLSVTFFGYHRVLTKAEGKINL